MKNKKIIYKNFYGTLMKCDYCGKTPAYVEWVGRNLVGVCDKKVCHKFLESSRFCNTMDEAQKFVRSIQSNT